MNSNKSPLDIWLSGVNAATDTGQEFWDPGFDGERRIVVSSFGPYHRVFERPQHFIPRFFHTVYPLLIEEWHISHTVNLFGGFCAMNVALQLTFQPTFKYAKRNIDALSHLNQQIKTGNENLLKDLANAELLKLNDGDWVKTGLTAMERQIENLINETMTLKHIQCRAICSLKPVFEELSEHKELDGRFTRAPIYISVLQKNFEFREKQRQELFRQEEELERQRLAHKQKQLENINQETELQRHKQALETEAAKQLLADQEQQRLEQYAIEARLYAEKVNHQTQLKEIEQAAEVQYEKEQQILKQQVELELQAQQFEHERLLKNQERDAQLKEYEQQRKQWLQAKEQEQQLKQIELEAELKEQELLQREQQKRQEQLEAEKINHQNRLTEMQLNAELKALAMRADAAQNKDEYLRKEIEWLVLDKQRAELARGIRIANQESNDTKNNL